MSIKPKRIASVIVTAVFAATPFVAIWQRQAIFDTWRLYKYTPSSQIVGLADRTTMTDESKHLFYVYHAKLEDKDAFNSNCSNTEKSIVLGCYVTNRGIYIYNVTDERLAGIQEVTAAHETLHAAYDRLGGKDRTRIDALTKAVEAKLTNPRIIKSLKAYRDRDPSVVPNELHSIIATEVRDIPTELELYYAKYFKDRKVVVGYSEKYEQAFTERQQKAEQLLKRIEALKKEIESLDISLATTRSSLDREYAQLEADRNNADPEPYNARVRAFNAKVGQYNNSIRYYQGIVNKHNALIPEYNAVVLEENELIKAIDSRQQTFDQ